jgi:pilus assembly protein CpaC
MVAATLALAGSPEVALAQPRGKNGDAKPEDKSLSLGVGENKTLPANDVKQYSEGTPGIAEIKITPDNKKFIISGQKAGTTSLLLIRNDGTQVNWTIRVYSQAPDEVENELLQLLDGYTGIRVRRIGTRLFIEGGVQNQADMDRIKQIADLYPGQVESLVTVGTGAVDRNLNVRIDFFFVQYNRGSSYGVGISWPQRIGGEGVIQSAFGYDFIARTATERHQVIGLPLLSRIPVFGLLFGSHSDVQDDVEGAVFIIPSVVESVPKGSYDMVKAALDQYASYSGSIGSVNSFSKAPPAYGNEGATGAKKKK